MSDQEPLNARDLWGSDPDQIICYRNNGDGVVVSCNSAAAAFFDIGETTLVGQHIETLRHPEMPDVYYDIIGARMREGRIAASYQNRRTPAGKDVWMATMIIPCGEGHLVLNLNPRTQLVKKVAQVYEKVREQEAGLSKDAAAKLLRHSLAGLGFANHEEYMTSLYSRELQAWTHAQGRPDSAPTKLLDSILHAVQTTTGHIDALVKIFERTEQVPTNMRLQANILEGQNGPISVVSDNHRSMTQQMQAVVGKLKDMSTLGERNICAGALQVATAQALRELIAQDGDHVQAAGGTWADDRKVLRDMEAQSRTAATEQLNDIRMGAQRLSHVCRSLRRQLTGLEMSRMMCEMERAKLNRPAEGLSSIVATLGEAQHKLDAEVVQIEAALSHVTAAANDIGKQLSRAENRTAPSAAA